MTGWLVVTRKDGEGVWIGDTLVKVNVKGGKVKLAINAPEDVAVVREELEEVEDG